MSEMSGDEVRARLAALVDDARRAGLGWDEVARVLGAAADDARHRAGGGAAEPAGQEQAEPHAGTPAPERTAKIGPVTMFTEMAALERAGRHGWKVVGTGSAMHLVAHTGEQWEFRRVLASRATGRALAADGWHRFSSGWFPWGYYQRPTGRPAEEEQVVGGYVVEP